MQKSWLQWSTLLLITAGSAFCAARSPYFPGDIALAKFIQALSGDNLGWARVVTSTISSPWNYVLLTLTAALAWWLAGWRGAVIALISFGGMVFAEPYLKALIARPRPSAQLIRVTGAPAGFSFPSGFGLVFFSLVGLLAILAWRKLQGNLRTIVIAICCVLLLLGGYARVSLGAHWPSDILGAYLCSGTWVFLLILLSEKIGSPLLSSSSSNAGNY